MSKAIKYFSMFTGIGGFEIGIQNAFRATHRGSEENSTATHEDGQGLLAASREATRSKDGRPGPGTTDKSDERPLLVGYSEIDKYAINTYERQFNGHTNYGDATKINATELPDFDLLVGGFPCQSFSIAGKRKGFDDTRGTLFFDIARILAEKRPRHLVLENVKGLLSHNGGETFQTILGVLSDLGYFVEWQVLNSKDFGVPQNRERVFIVGHLRGVPRRKVFPIFGSHNTATQEYVGAIGTPRLERDKHLSRGHKQPARVFAPNGISPTISSQETQGRYHITNGQDNRQDQTKPDTNFQPGREESTLRIRRLTPLECERLQGFPDNWTVGSDTQRYKQCGNAVTVNVVQAVMTRLLNRGCL